MAANIRGRFVDLVARNLREPKGLGGFFVKALLIKSNSSLEIEVVENLNIQTNHKVLEVGFGPGAGLSAALKKVEDGDGKVFGVDISEQMVNHVKGHLKSAIEKQKLEVLLGSVMELPFSDTQFDRVFHTNCYYFWPNLEQGISELKRVMTPGGLMVTGLDYEKVKTANSRGFLKYGPLWEPEAYMEKLTEGGFVNVTMETLTEPSGCSYQVIFASKESSTAN